MNKVSPATTAPSGIAAPQPARPELTSVITLASAAAVHLGARHPGGAPGGGGDGPEEPGELLTQADVDSKTKHAARIRHLAVCHVSVTGAHTLGSTSERYEDGGRTHGWMLPAASFHSYEREVGAEPSRPSGWAGPRMRSRSPGGGRILIR